MNDERARKCLRQLEHFRGHLWHRYSVPVNQETMATISNDFHFDDRNPWFSSFLVNSNPLSRKSRVVKIINLQLILIHLVSIHFIVSVPIQNSSLHPRQFQWAVSTSILNSNKKRLEISNGVIRIRKSENGRQRNGQKKKDKQRPTKHT